MSDLLCLYFDPDCLNCQWYKKEDVHLCRSVINHNPVLCNSFGHCYDCRYLDSDDEGITYYCRLGYEIDPVDHE